MSDFDLALGRFRTRVLVVALAVILACSALVLGVVARHQYVALPPELAAKHVNVGNLLGREIRRAVDLGIPLAELRGLDLLFRDVRVANPEIAFIHFTPGNGAEMTADSDGTIPGDRARLRSLPLTGHGNEPVVTELDGHGVLALPVAGRDGGVLGRLAIGVDGHYVARLVGDRLFDLVTVQIVSAILTVEVLLLCFDFWVTAPMLGIQAWAGSVSRRVLPLPLHWRVDNELGRFVDRLHNLAHAMRWPQPEHGRRGAALPWPVMLRFIRVALFAFVLADTLSLSFLPLFAREVFSPLWGIGPEVGLSLPVMIYWLTSAVVQLPGAGLLDRFSHRAVFGGGAAVSVAGALVSALAPNFAVLLAGRALSGLGLGLVFMVCQAAILTHVPQERRAYGIATFTGVFFLATFSGAALGGVVAEEIGFRATFLVSAVVAVLAALFAHLSFGSSREDRRARRAQAAAPVSAADYRPLLVNPRFVGLLLFSALPNRVFNVALVFYLAPVFLFSLDNSKAEIGRIVALYGLTMALVAPLAARLVDRRGWHFASVAAGSALTAAGGLTMFFLPGTLGVGIAIFAMGLGQSLSIPSQMAMLPAVTAGQAEVLGLPRIYAVFRVGERIPAFIGPVLGGALAALFGYGNAIVVFGGWLVLATLFLLGLYRFAPAPSGVEP